MGVWETSFVAVVITIMFVMLWKNFYSPEIVVLAALIVIWNAGIIDTSDALSGFSNSGMLAVGTLFAVVKGIEKCRLLDKVSRRLFGLDSTVRMGLLRLMMTTFCMSAFLNNTPIVAALIPVTRDWARMRGFAPSIFLMPLSFSCILGGLLTIIGTSTNLVVNGIIEDAGIPPIAFFEPGYVALPIGIICIAFMTLVAPALLPKTGGMFRLVRDQAHELITEIEVEDTCVFIGKPLASLLAHLNVPMEVVIKVRRRATGDNVSVTRQPSQSKHFYEHTRGELWGKNASSTTEAAPTGTITDNGPDVSGPDSFVDIYPVLAQDAVQDGDIIFLSCSSSAMVDFHAKTASAPLKGLRILDVSALDLPGRGTQFFELVLGGGNKFDGATVGTMHHDFAKHYGASVIAVRRKQYYAADVEATAGTASPDTDSDDESEERMQQQQRDADKVAEVMKQHISAGDLVLVLAKDEFPETWKSQTGTLHSDFFLITGVGHVEPPVLKRDYIPVAIFVAMLLWVVLGDVDMVQAAMVAAILMISGGFISAREAINYVDWALLLLIGSALGLSKAMDKSGLAGYVGNAIADAGLSAYLSLVLIFTFCTLMTELITNNAAAALCTPLALSIASSLDVDPKPFVIIIMIGASASFLTPIGYQTNTMVWAPGGYKFTDFLKLGVSLSIVMSAITLVLVPLVFPF